MLVSVVVAVCPALFLSTVSFLVRRRFGVASIAHWPEQYTAIAFVRTSQPNIQIKLHSRPVEILPCSVVHPINRHKTRCSKTRSRQSGYPGLSKQTLVRYDNNINCVYFVHHDANALTQTSGQCTYDDGTLPVSSSNFGKVLHDRILWVFSASSRDGNA